MLLLQLVLLLLLLPLLLLCLKLLCKRFQPGLLLFCCLRLA
jgi:hypothetical protein